MINREKVLKGLFYCSGMGKCIDCPYKTQAFLSQCTTILAKDTLELITEQEQYIKELEDKLRLLEYGDQDTFKDTLMPAT